MRVTILGTGTSCGVPQIGCPCEVCTSSDPRDRRLRCSAIVDVHGKRILIDCGPDFREQMLTVDFRPLDAVLITHEHYDHVGGLDDLRPFCIFGDIDVYAEQFCIDHLMARMPYCFTPKDVRYPGVPSINLIPVEPRVPIIIKEHRFDNMIDEAHIDPPVAMRRREILASMQASASDEGEVEIIPIRVMHGRLPIVGYRIEHFAYITDMKTIPDTELQQLQGIDTLVVNGLRHKQHPSHQTIEDAIAFADRIGARRTYLIHMSHHILPHAQEEQKLPENTHLAYDGLVLEV